MFNLKTWAKDRQQIVHHRLHEIVEGLSVDSVRLKSAIQYTLADGKYIRPLLVFASYEVFKANYQDLLDPACALEFVHTYSLIHDDLPAMDNDDLRRGQASCHVRFDEATAVLTGDAMQALAFKLLADAPFDAKTKIKFIKTLSDASGAEGMVDGQALDMEFEKSNVELSTLTNMYHKKTSALINAAMMLGLIGAGADNKMNLENFNRVGHLLGLLFQIQDDILDVSVDTQTLGKPAGSDLINEKNTYVSILGLEAAKAQAIKCHEQIIDALESIEGQTQALQAISTLILSRKF